VKKLQIALRELDRMILDPSRLMILTVLYYRDKTEFRYLQKKCSLTAGNLSSHLAKLRAAGYVEIAKGFKRNYPVTLCSLTSRGREALGNCAQELGRFSGAGGISSKTREEGPRDRKALKTKGVE